MCSTRFTTRYTSVYHFVNDLPLQVSMCEAFDYLDDFQLVATNSKNMQYDIKQIEQWCLNKN